MPDPSATPTTPTPVTDVPTAATPEPEAPTTPAPETTGDASLAKLAANSSETPNGSDTTDDAKLPAGLLSDKAYDVLKWVAIIVLPALATFIVGLGGIWSWPIAGSVAATITAIGVLLGALLGLSSVKYASK